MECEPIIAGCASSMFYLAQTKSRPFLVRLSAKMDEPIELSALDEAIKRATACFPYVMSRFRCIKGTLAIAPLTRIPSATKLGEQEPHIDPDVYAALVQYDHDTVYFTFFHGVTDGMGGLEFFRALVAEYLRARGYDVACPPPSPLALQVEDGYRMNRRGLGGLPRHGRAYAIRGTLEARGLAHLTTFRMPTSCAKALSRRFGASVTEWAASLICTAIERLKNGTGDNHPVRLTVPVDLRRRFGSRTVRNFTLNVYPEVSEGANVESIGDTCREIRAYMRRNCDVERLARRCGQAVAAGDVAVGLMLPLEAKRQIARFCLDRSDMKSTLTFSSLGMVELPERANEHVLDIGIAFSSKPDSPYSAALLSFGEVESLSLLRTIEEPLLETELERLMKGMDIHYEKECEYGSVFG